MVIKFNPAGRVMMVFGRRRESADAETGPWERPDPPLAHVDGMFRQPTDVAWDSDGNIYISDGYINSRVAKYDKNGDWVKSWGERGTGPGQFRLPHAIASTAATTSTSAIGRTGASRCSTPTGSSCGCSRSTCRRRPARVPSTATRRPARRWPTSSARRIRSASRPGRTR